MGRVKEMMMEREEGLMHSFDEDKNVCAEHFNDPYLQAYINDTGHLGKCSYCGKRSGKVLSMSQFMDFIKSKLSQRLCPLDDANLPSASSWYDDDDEEIPGVSRIGCYAMPDNAERYESVPDLMDNYDLYTSDESLNEDIASCFNYDEFTRNDVFEEDLDEELSYAWNNFVKMVKYQKRYTFFQDPHFIRQEEWKDDVLTEINQLCSNVLVSRLPSGTTIFRGRPNDTGTPRTSFKDLTAPPVECAKENRMSAAGISMFYGALDPDTPIEEIRNYEPAAVIDLGEFILKKELVVIDLFKIPVRLSFWMPQYYLEYKFLKKFHSEITKPITKNPGIEYVPTQIFTEYIRFMSNKHIDGIMYKSSLTGKKNIVLFYDNNTTADILELKDVSNV